MDSRWREAFRSQMKSKGITYAAMAGKLGLSTAGFKKVLQKDDIPLNRFLRICQLLQIDPGKLVAIESKDGLPLKVFSRKLDRFFLEHPEAFDFYWCLTMERLTLSATRQRIGISLTEAYRFLRQLEEFKVLRWEENDVISVPEDTRFLFDERSQSAMRFAQTQAEQMVRKAFELKNKARPYMAVRYVELSEAEILTLTTKLNDEINRVCRDEIFKGTHETKTRGKNPVRILCSVQPGEIDFSDRRLKA